MKVMHSVQTDSSLQSVCVASGGRVASGSTSIALVAVGSRGMHSATVNVNTANTCCEWMQTDATTVGVDANTVDANSASANSVGAACQSALANATDALVLNGVNRVAVCHSHTLSLVDLFDCSYSDSIRFAHACTAIDYHILNNCSIVEVGSDASINIISLDPFKPILEIINADSALITCIKYRSVNDVVVCSDAGRISTYDIRSGQCVNSWIDLENPFVALNCIAVHPTQNTTLATGNADGTAKIWDLRSLKHPEVRSFKVHSSDVWDISFPPTNAYNLTTASQDGSIATFTWNDNHPDTFLSSAKKANKVNRISSPSGFAVTSIDWHPELDILAGVSEVGDIFVVSL